jgi:hypothetical protein
MIQLWEQYGDLLKAARLVGDQVEQLSPDRGMGEMAALIQRVFAIKEQASDVRLEFEVVKQNALVMIELDRVK